MAVNKNKKKLVFLGNLVKENISDFAESRTRIRNLREADYLRTVVDNGMTYEDQLTYRKKQLEEEKAADTPDSTFISEIKSEISNLGKLAKAEAFRKAYLESFTQLKTQKKSYEDHINFLQDMSDTSTDPTLKADIDQKLSDAKVASFQADNDAVVNRANLAANDKSYELLNKSISEITSKRNQALASKDESAVAKWDLALSSLKSSLVSVGIQDRMSDLQIQNMQKPVNSTDLLNFYKNNLKSASTENIPLTVDGVKYKSAQEYWQGKTNDFIQNNFFTMLGTELNDKISTASKKLSPVLESEIQAANDTISNLQNISELQPFAQQFDKLKTNLNTAGITAVGAKVVDDYTNGRLGSTTAANYANAVAKLNALNSTYNVDVSGYVNQITEDMASKKESVAKNIIEVAGSKGISTEAASKMVPNIDIPTGQLANMNPTDVAETAKTSLGKTDSQYGISKTTNPVIPAKTEQPPAAEAAPFSNESAPTGETPAPLGFKEVVVQKGETLSSIAKRELGNAAKYTDIAKYNSITDPNKISIGQKIKIQTQ